ncbi:CD9 antigen-like isoform X1 [Mugil cephalus]|uniref:CD9 antigen-like isoform X1 n=1 Tax=Mugil cephalus TaxID=48193 RepID=UPI001FB7532D|nr:CD9 antigen-like isoform X1 [Mugil cephalus]XP_047427699.1 CD9 antigen-like isoform X1 [Mugil cephalus]
MALDGCGHVCKYILIIFNIIFAVVGFALLGLGLWLRFSDNTRSIFEIEQLNSSAFVLGVTVLIVLGAVMLIVVVFGDYGACNEKRCALQVFSALLSIMALAEIVVGVLAYSNSDRVGNFMGEFYTSIYTVYIATGDPPLAVTLTFIHKMLHCCGITGVSLIEMVKETCPKPDGFLEHIAMPSCPNLIANAFESKASLVLGLFVGTGALLIIAMICSAVLTKQIQRSASASRHIILTQTIQAPAPAPASLPPPQHAFEAKPYPYPYPYQDPVVFTPLSAVTLPAVQT